MKTSEERNLAKMAGTGAKMLSTRTNPDHCLPQTRWEQEIVFGTADLARCGFRGLDETLSNIMSCSCFPPRPHVTFPPPPKEDDQVSIV